jgi:predicted amino acid racemase
MFLELLKRKNANLIKAAVTMHQAGLIPPNTFVLDADRIVDNVSYIRREAAKWNLNLYFMLKQIRNPQIADFILDRNRAETVCIDTKDAKVVWESGHKLGHVGHLVQTPNSEVREILLMQPEVMTVFSVAKARKISEEAGKLGREQALLLRVTNPSDMNYPSMEGGIQEAELESVAREIGKLPHARIVGVTNFPAMKHTNKEQAEVTPNLGTSVRCAEKLRKLGFEITQVNAPGNSCTYSMEAYSKGGATHVEPGHGITGTTPFALAHDEMPEIPAMIYVTEVLHNHLGTAYLHGGGFYWEDRIAVPPDFRNHALVGTDENNILEGEATFLGVAPAGQQVLIDYYGLLEPGAKPIDIGDTAIFGFRSQAFATRCANTALIRGCKTGNYTLMGVYDHCSHRLERWP